MNEKYKNYEFEIDCADFNPENEMMNVVLTLNNGEKYCANFTTVQFISSMFEKNKETGELLYGTYFCMPDNMIIIKKLTSENIKATIDDLIDNLEISCYFKKIN